MSQLKQERKEAEGKSFQPKRIVLPSREDVRVGEEHVNEMIRQYRLDFKEGRKKTQKQMIKKMMQQIKTNFGREMIQRLGHRRLELERGVTTLGLQGEIQRIEHPKLKNSILVQPDAVVVEDAKQQRKEE